MVDYSSQAADRRDRLIYVLSQINAARGDDAMHIDDESSDDSDDEARGLDFTSLFPANLRTRRKNSILQAP